MTLHGSRVAWSLSVLMVLVGVSGCGGTSDPCPHPRPYPGRGSVSDIKSAPAEDTATAGNLSLTYQTQGNVSVSSATELRQNGVNFFGTQALHVPLRGLSTVNLAFSVPSQSATKSAWDLDVTFYLLDGVRGVVTYYGANMAEVGSETNYQATLVDPGLGVIPGTPGAQMMIDLKKTDGSVSEIYVLIDLDDQTSAKEGA